MWVRPNDVHAPKFLMCGSETNVPSIPCITDLR